MTGISIMHVRLYITKSLEKEDVDVLDTIMKEQFACHRQCMYRDWDGIEVFCYNVQLHEIPTDASTTSSSNIHQNLQKNIVRAIGQHFPLIDAIMLYGTCQLGSYGHSVQSVKALRVGQVIEKTDVSIAD